MRSQVGGHFPFNDSISKKCENGAKGGQALNLLSARRLPVFATIIGEYGIQLPHQRREIYRGDSERGRRRRKMKEEEDEGGPEALAFRLSSFSSFLASLTMPSILFCASETERMRAKRKGQGQGQTGGSERGRSLSFSKLSLMDSR